MLAPWGAWKRLSHTDASLLHAYSIHKASRCPCGCGQPAEVSLDEAARDVVDVDASATCAFKAALEEWQKNNPEREPGVLVRPVLDQRDYERAKARLAKRRDNGDG